MEEQIQMGSVEYPFIGVKWYGDERKAIERN